MHRRGRSPALTAGAVALAILGWASLHPVAKGVVAGVGAIQVAFDRALIAAVVLCALAAARGGPRTLAGELRRQPGRTFLFALLSFALSSPLALAALRWLPAGVNSVFNNMGPLWLAIGTALAGHSRRPLALLGGAAVAFLGVALVALPEGAGGALAWRGVALSVASSVVIAAQAVYGRRLLPGRDPLAVTGLAAGMAALALALALPFAGGVRPLLAAPPAAKVALLYLGLGATALNFACWSYALQRLPATRALLWQNLIPPLGVLLAVLFLHEPLGGGLAAGVLLIVGGTWLAQRGAGAARAVDERAAASTGAGRG